MSDMSKTGFMVLYFVVMIGLIVGLDVLFLRHHFEARLIVNICIVAAFAGIYFAFLKDR